jgi:phage terminase small subunit
LTEDQKACIQEISTQIKTSRNADGTLEENEYVKVKLYDKQRAIDSLTKMFGYAEPDKLQVDDRRKQTFEIGGQKIEF